MKTLRTGTILLVQPASIAHISRTGGQQHRLKFLHDLHSAAHQQSESEILKVHTMATFWGEVLTLSSRAVDDDDDEDEEGNESQSRYPEPIVQWKPEFTEELTHFVNQKVRCKTLIVAIGPTATGFIEAYILSKAARLIGVIDSKLHRSEVRPEFIAGHCTYSVYHPAEHPDVIVCQCTTEIPLEVVHMWTEKLFGALDLANLEVIVMDTTPTVEYRTHLSLSEIQSPFLRSLQSSTVCHEKHCCPILESPNAIKGLSAAVLSHCQVYGLSCIVYIAYMSSLFLHTDDFKVFAPLLTVKPLTGLCQDNAEAETILQKLVERRALQGSLYT